MEDVFFLIKPSSPAQLGRNTLFDKTTNPWRVEKMHLVFDLFSSDDLLKESPGFYVSSKLADYLNERDFSGVSVKGGVDVEFSETYIRLYGEQSLPKYHLLLIDGVPGQCDFGLTDSFKLIVSKRAMIALQGFSLEEAVITNWESMP